MSRDQDVTNSYRMGKTGIDVKLDRKKMDYSLKKDVYETPQYPSHQTVRPISAVNKTNTNLATYRRTLFHCKVLEETLQSQNTFHIPRNC